MDSAIKQINVEEIMVEIRKEIDEKGYRNETVLFSEIPLNTGSYEDNLGALHDRYTVATYRVLESKGALGAIKVFFRKIIRKLIRFYVDPIVFDQNEINKITIMCLHDFYFDNETMRRKIQALEDEIKQLRGK